MTLRLNCTLLEVRAQLDAFTYNGVIWNPYATHRVTRPLMNIAIFCGFIRLGEIVHRHLSDCVLRQFGFMQHIPRSPLSIGDFGLADIDARWIRFAGHVLKGLLPAIPPYSYVDGYL